jgi:SPP1 family predicted phage head-tail adaptor
VSCVNDRRHRVTVQGVTRTADSEGGYTEAYAALSPSTWWVAIQPASVRSLERFVASTIQAKATHVVTGRYRSDVNTNTRLVFGSRTLYVRGVQNVDELNRELLVACEEVVT